VISDSAFYCVVAEPEGRILGSNCLDERSVIAGLGPVTVDSSVQDRGVGRKLMEAILARARERSFTGVYGSSNRRFVTDPWHCIAYWALMLASRSRSCRDRRFGNGLKGARFEEREFRTLRIVNAFAY
jgi:hypothetical protein